MNPNVNPYLGLATLFFMLLFWIWPRFRNAPNIYNWVFYLFYFGGLVMYAVANLIHILFGWDKGFDFFERFFYGVIPTMMVILGCLNILEIFFKIPKE